jgi:hypothetical protein
MRDGPTLIVRWVHAVAEATKAAWYLFLRKSRFVEPVFAGLGLRLAVGRGNADARRQPHQPSAEHAQFASEDPLLRASRQRAVLDLFEFLGVEQIPESYWTILERVGDPERALAAFISNSGLNVKLVQTRRATELAAFQSFVRFVCQVEKLAKVLSDQQRTLLDGFMSRGEHANARRLLELFVTLNDAVDLFERWPGARFAAFAMRARRVTTLREHATLADLSEAEALLEASQYHAHLMGRFRNAEDRMERIEAVASEQWEALMPSDQAIWFDVLSDLEQGRDALMDDPVCDVERQLEDFERSVERLSILSDELSLLGRDSAVARASGQRKRWKGRKARREEARRKRTRRHEEHQDVRTDLDGREARELSRDELLSIFGFAPGMSPELSALRQAFIREAGKTLPVVGQVDYQRRNERFRLIKDAYERLKTGLD